MEKEIEIKVNQKVHIPDTPNFIIVGENRTVLPVADFTNEELKAIGDRWTGDLIVKATERRNEKLTIQK